MADNKPTHRLVHVSERPDKRGNKVAVYTEICGLWQTDKGNISGSIPEGMTLSGRLLITSADRKTEDAEADHEAALSET